MSEEHEQAQRFTNYPGVKVALAGGVTLIAALLWSVLVPSPDSPFGVAELLALAGAGLVLGGCWRGGLALLREDGRPRDE